ncbi:hypothetical protein [Sphingomonas azotifigens]|uniref:hypothetical protein n=1 Tax=Sphingomonas azotifigens TaxID=330920 RepID=UPI000A022B4B|nr:hypothetical protein [Sphingomonas azotifigens]
MPVQSLREITRDILGMTEQILRAGTPPIDQQHLADLRKKVALAHNDFFAEQERVLLRPLRQSGDPALAAIARCCVERDLEGRQLGLVHYQRWTLARIVDDPAGYREEVRNILRWMEARVVYAEQTAYPALVKIISSTQRHPAV